LGPAPPVSGVVKAVCLLPMHVCACMPLGGGGDGRRRGWGVPPRVDVWAVGATPCLASPLCA
jgi:hypothetical protein